MLVGHVFPGNDVFPSTVWVIVGNSVFPKAILVEAGFAW